MSIQSDRNESGRAELKVSAAMEGKGIPLESIPSHILSGYGISIYSELTVHDGQGAEKSCFESFELQNILMKGNDFLAICDANRATNEVRGKIERFSSFAFNNFSNTSVEIQVRSRLRSLLGEPVIAVISDTRNTDSRRFVLKRRFTPIWDSAQKDDPEKVVKPIRNGKKFRLAMLDGDELWHTHLVDMPFFWCDDGLFQMQTHVTILPLFMGSPGEYLRYLVESGMAAPSSGPNAVKMARQRRAEQGFDSYISAFSNGVYYNGKDRCEGGRYRQYQRLIVFCER